MRVKGLSVVYSGLCSQIHLGFGYIGHVAETNLGAEDALERFLQQIKVLAFKLLTDEGRGNGQC